MKRVQLLAEAKAGKLNRALDPLRSNQYTAMVGGRYMQRVASVRTVARLVKQQKFWTEAAALLKMPEEWLSFLSMSALDVLPGDKGLGEHVDYPHHVFPDSAHLSAQFVLSLDGTDDKRAPLWIDTPENRVCLAPGELVIFGGNTKHGVHPNESDRGRTTLLWSIGPLWVRPMIRDVWDWTKTPQVKLNRRRKKA